jgi:hypothetical protein
MRGVIDGSLSIQHIAPAGISAEFAITQRRIRNKSRGTYGKPACMILPWRRGGAGQTAAKAVACYDPRLDR